MPVLSAEHLNLAEKNVRDILNLAIEHCSSAEATIVFDRGCALSETLAESYRRCLPAANFVNFEETSPETIRTGFDLLKPSDLVILIQSTNFRLNEFRVRVELFNRSLKVIEHPHLSRMEGEEVLIYIESLAYDPDYYRVMGRALKERIDRARLGVVDSGSERLIFDSGFEPAKLNVGDYSGMKNTGGQFPIGEVFTEAKDLESVSGRVRVFAFGDTTFRVNKPQTPVIVEVARGRVCGVENSTPEFDRVLANIRADEGEVWVRELGFGLNRAFTRERMVRDIGTYERMCGVHLSLGAKHTIYKKPDFLSQKIARHHIDIFAETRSVDLDGRCVYRNGAWQA